MRSEFAQHVSAVGSLGGALDGTPVKRKRSSAKKADPNSSVITAVRCECGDQFDDFRSAWLHVYQGHCAVLTNVGEMRNAVGARLVAECGTLGGSGRHRRNGEPPCDACKAAQRDWARGRRADPVVRQRIREWERDRSRRRRADPEYRELDRERKREYWTTPEYQDWQRAYKARKRSDPEYLERERKQQREREAARRLDPEYRALKNERERAARARKKAEQGVTADAH